MTIKIPEVDVNKGLELFEGDLDTYVGILRSYVLNIPAGLDRIRSVSEETLQNYAIGVHGIKGTSEAIGAEEARKTAKNLEEMAKSGNIAGVLAKNSDFIRYIENLTNGIRIWLEKYDASGEPPS